MFERLKARWQVESNFQLIIIFIVFSITGSATVVAKKYLFGLMNINSDIPLYLLIPIYIITIIPIYQTLLIIIGTLLGQFQFFWKFEKKMLRRFGIKIDK